MPLLRVRKRNSIRFESTRTEKQATSDRERTIRFLPGRALVIGFNSSCYDIPLVKAKLLEYLFLFGFVKTGQTVRGAWYAEERNELANCHL